MNTNYKLQLRHHSEVFETRELAVEYIDTIAKYNCVLAEPTIYFYGDIKKPNMILGICSGDKKISLIDIAEIDERVVKLTEESILTQDELEVISKVIDDIVNSCGLIFDSNKIENKVTYTPDSKDILLHDSKSINESLNILSKFAQEHCTDGKLVIPQNTKSITLSYVETDKEKNLFADVNISSSGQKDDSSFNDNIIGVKDDGLFVATDLDYNEQSRILTFTTSGVKNGVFVDDAKRKSFNLGEHTKYSEYNDGHNVKIQVVENNISADVNILDHENNILVSKNNNLFVDGQASNISYNNTTVANTLDATNESIKEINNKITEIINNDIVEGVESNTVNITTTTGLNGNGHIVKGDVLLSNDKSIIVSDGGLSANIGIDIDVHQNKLYLNVGNKIVEKDLPGVNLIDNIVYDQNSTSITITFDNGKTATIPVADLIVDYTFNNDTSQPVKLNTTINDNGSINVNTYLELSSDDNILVVSDGKLSAPKSTIDTAVQNETERAINAEKELVNSISSNEERINIIDQYLIQQNDFINILDEKVSILNGNVDTKGSILETVKHYSDDTLLFAKNYTNEVILNKVDQDLVYTKTDIDNKFASYATKEDVNIKANTNDVYTKSDIDNKGFAFEVDLLQKANKDDVYSKHDADNFFATKTNVAESLNTKADKTDLETKVTVGTVYTKNETLELLTVKADKSEVYTKEQIDAKGYLTQHQDISNLLSKEEAANKYIALKTAVSSNVNNLITMDSNGALFANNDALYHYVLWNGNKISVQEAITTLKHTVDGDDGEGEALKSRVASLEAEIEQLKEQLSKIQTATLDTDVTSTLSILSGVDESKFNDGVDSNIDKNKISVDMGQY